MSFCDSEDAKCAASLISTMLSYAKGIGAAAVNKLQEISSELMEFEKRYNQAAAEGKSLDDVDKEWLEKKNLELMKECRDIIKDANSSGDDKNKLLSVLDVAKKAYKIATDCEHSYNKLHPKDSNGKGDKLQTIKEYADVLNDFYEIGMELFGVKEWEVLLKEDGEDLIGYLLTCDFENQSVDEIVANCPYPNTLDECRKLSNRIINTSNKYDSLRSRSNSRKANISSRITKGNNRVTANENLNSNNYISLERMTPYMEDLIEINSNAQKEGYISQNDKFKNDYAAYLEYYSEPSAHVCASISLKFSQTMKMTRQAFKGVLEVYNGNKSKAMKDVKLEIIVSNEEGLVASSHEFQVNLDSLTGFSGNMNMVDGWQLEAESKGSASILFIPTKFAAPTEPVRYSFGGRLIYIDPYTDLEVTRELTPVTLMVNPSPELDLTYFMQRDIIGDDPLTTDVVEPTQPAEFALIINNKGNGDAKNVRMVTKQPEIVENEKGLNSKFVLESSQLNGNPATMAFGRSTANDFGTIPSHSQAYVQWWLRSELLGHFTEYDVSVNHVTSYGNDSLSLLDQVSIHELIHGFTVRTDGERPIRGFLVNDIADSEDLPDSVYFTDATQQSAYIATSASITKQSITEYVLTVNASAPGWNYGSLFDPTYGKQKLVKVVRSDGKEMNVDNIWQTDRTLRDGKDWLYENRLHFVGLMGEIGETYTLTFEPRPDVELEVASITGMPEGNAIAQVPVETLTVTFNKAIDPTTFTTEDIWLDVQGEKQDVSCIGIISTDNQVFTLDLSALQCGNGCYIFTVNTIGITDNEGYQGKNGKSESWTMYSGGLVQLNTSVNPANAGTLKRKSNPEQAVNGSFAYGSSVVIQAQANEGYRFSKWKLDGIDVEESSTEYVFNSLSNSTLVAEFVKDNYPVTITTEKGGGQIENCATGYYEYGKSMTMKAVAEDGYVFYEWIKDDVPIAGHDETLTVTVDMSHHIKARFVPRGDGDGNGTVDLQDAIKTVRSWLGKHPENYYDAAADMNGDGIIDGQDALLIVKKFLNK